MRTDFFGDVVIKGLRIQTPEYVTLMRGGAKHVGAVHHQIRLADWCYYVVLAGAIYEMDCV